MQVTKINQAQPKNFKGTSVSVGPSSWRSSVGSIGGGYSYAPRTYGYGWGFDPFMYMWLANRPTYVQNLSADDIRKEQQEAAKDKIFLQENPELVKQKHPVMKGAIAGTIATVATMFLTKGIEIIKNADIRKINFDPVLIITSAVLGTLTGFLVKKASMPNARMERLVREEKSKQEVPKTENQEEQG